MQIPQKGCRRVFDVSLNQKKVCQLRPTLLFEVATLNPFTVFDPTNLGNTSINDLANDFAMIGLVHNTMIVL